MKNYNTEKEVWKDVKDFEGYYEISNLGRLRRKTRHITDKNGVVKLWQGKILKYTKNPDGYPIFIMSKNAKTKYKSGHRMVAEAFIENPNDYPVVNHKDENPANNHVGNLEWCTIEYNNAYGTRTERMKNSKGFKERHRKNRKPVFKVSLGGEILKEFKSLKEAYQSDSEYTKSGVANCCNGHLNTYKGYFWIYKDGFTDKEVKSRIDKANTTQEVKVNQLDLDGDFIKQHKSMSQGARETGVNSGSIHQCCNGKMKSAGSYKWEYAN